MPSEGQSRNITQTCSFSIPYDSLFDSCVKCINKELPPPKSTRTYSDINEFYMGHYEIFEQNRSSGVIKAAIRNPLSIMGEGIAPRDSKNYYYITIDRSGNVRVEFSIAAPILIFLSRKDMEEKIGAFWQKLDIFL